MSNPWILVPFGIGTAAFFVTLYLSLFVPKASDTPWREDASAEVHPLRRWDTVITWVMWGGWGVAMVMRFLDRNDLLSRLTG
jgi:hypothetical protein